MINDEQRYAYSLKFQLPNVPLIVSLVEQKWLDKSLNHRRGMKVTFDSAHTLVDLFVFKCDEIKKLDKSFLFHLFLVIYECNKRSVDV